MKKHYFMMAVLLGAASVTKGQDTYQNDRLTATDDINGTARYMAMGGAMGALGADLSVISSNPAGIGLYRKSDVAMTFGAIVPTTANGWNSDEARSRYERLPRATFDQFGFVWSLNIGGSKLKYVNLGVNYQKKANYNLGFYADNLNLNELSQMDQVTELAMGDDRGTFATDYNLAGLAYDNGYLLLDDQGNVQNNPYSGERSYYGRHQTGAMQAYDFNVAFNLSERFYAGLTFGVDNVNYSSWSLYSEDSTNPSNGQYGDYTLYNQRDIDGVGLNAKFGFIVRPVQDSPFRVGLTVETPTWYRLKNSTYFDLSDNVANTRTESIESYLETTIRTPWRMRLSMGTTIDKFMAWGIEYEYANVSKTRMGYPEYDWDDPYHSAYASVKDVSMNELTKQVLRSQHTLRLGMEVKPIDALALRVGYNFISNRYKSNATFDQYSLNSYAMDYSTSTDYMTLGATNIVTFGLGYKYKAFYVDAAYKYRTQKAKFYAFDTSFTEAGSAFSEANPLLSGATIEPVNIDLNRHQVTLSLGFKF